MFLFLSLWMTNENDANFSFILLHLAKKKLMLKSTALMINTREWKKARRNHISAVFSEVSVARNACLKISRIFRTNFTFEACLIQGTGCFVYKFICVCNRVISGDFLRYLNDNCQGYFVSHIQMDSDRYRAIEYDIHPSITYVKCRSSKYIAIFRRMCEILPKKIHHICIITEVW